MTDPNKTYVIARHNSLGNHANGYPRKPLYLCVSKGKKSTSYWGLYIGTLGKRYGAERFQGGESLDSLLEKNADKNIFAVEVKK